MPKCIDFLRSWLLAEEPSVAEWVDWTVSKE